MGIYEKKWIVFFFFVRLLHQIRIWIANESTFGHTVCVCCRVEMAYVSFDLTFIVKCVHYMKTMGLRMEFIYHNEIYCLMLRVSFKQQFRELIRFMSICICIYSLCGQRKWTMTKTKWKKLKRKKREYKRT